MGLHFSKDQIANIYTDSWYAFRVVHDFGMLWKQHGFFISSRNKIKNDPYVQELPATSRFCSILNLTLWKLREITLMIFPQGMLPLKGSTAVKTQKGYSPKW